MKVLLLSRFNRLGASSRVRLYQYLPFLKNQGIEVTVAPLLEDNYLSAFYDSKVNHIKTRIVPYSRRFFQLLKSKCFDLLWIQQELFPWLPPWVEVLVAKSGIPYIVDYDDGTFHRYDKHPNVFIRKILGKKIDVIMRHAARVIVCNKYLAEHALQAGVRSVEILPTVVDLDRYVLDKGSRKDSFTIGWIGTPLTVHYLNSIKSVFLEFSKKNDFHIVIVGGKNFELKGCTVLIREWSEDSEVSEIQNFDVGIMPLPDKPFERGKCGYKLIQYMACGKPVVASSVGVNSRIVDHGLNGFLANTEEEWIKALSILYDNPELRNKMGEIGRKKIEKEYCLKVTSPRLLSIIHDVVKDN